MAKRRTGTVSEDIGNGHDVSSSRENSSKYPRSDDAEEQLVGAFQLDPTTIDIGMTLVQPEAFFNPHYSKIIKALYSLREAMKQIDLVSIRRELLKIYGEGENCDELTQVALRCMENTIHAGHVEYHCAEVKSAFLKREFIRQTTQCIHDAASAACRIEDVLSRSEAELHKLIEKGTPSKSVSISDALMLVFDEHTKERRSGIQTTWGELDRIIDGLMPGTLTVIAARPSMGKTALALNVARNIGKKGAKVLFFSMEQPQLELAERLLALESQVSIHDMRHDGCDEAAHWSMSEAANRLSDIQLRIDERNYLTPTKLSALARMEKRRFGMDVMIIDYLQLVEPDDHRMPREQQVATCCRHMKCMAKELDVPVIILAQLNRQVENREDKAPKLADLRESGAIEQDADQVWFVWRPEVYDPNNEPGIAYVKVAKNRNGPLGRVKFAFRAPYFRFDVLADDPEPADSYVWGN